MADATQYTYQKKRKEFGRHAQFEDTDTKIVGSIPPAPQNAQNYHTRDPNRMVLSNIPQMSHHSVNTERIPTGSKGMKHVVGGWPIEFDPTETADVAKYEKKMYRELSLGFSAATKAMSQGATKCILQNNEIDLFEEYFAGEQAEHSVEQINTKTLMIFKDPNPVKRAATKIAWHPDMSEPRIGVTYAMLRFQQMPNDMPRESYIWNLQNPNFPEKTLLPPSPLCCMAFNNKSAEIIVGGSYNGSLSFFDTRMGNSAGVIKPFKTTILEKSHHDPVYNVEWTAIGKTGSECVSSSTDGRLLWWDFKEGNTPTDQLVLNEDFPDAEGNTKSKILGATSLCYHAEAGPLKYLVGTEQGYILQAQKRKTIDIQQKFGLEGGKHHGPVYSLTRNPGHSKFFMSVGDWQAKIWTEDLKSPIMQTRYHSAYLTDGCWSNSRPGLFYLTRIDGFLDVWDFYYRQNEVAYSQKISDNPLTSVSVQNNMIAIGDAEGTVSIMKLCPALYEQANKEKEIMQTIFDREFRREKNLEIAKKLAQGDPKKKKEAPVKVDPKKEAEEKKAAMKETINNLEGSFFKHIAKDEQDLDEIKARGQAAMNRVVDESPAKVNEPTGMTAGTYVFKYGSNQANITCAADGKLTSADEGVGNVQMIGDTHLKIDLINGSSIECPIADLNNCPVKITDAEGNVTNESGSLTLM